MASSYYCVFYELLNFRHLYRHKPALIQLMMDTLYKMHRGQGVDVMWSANGVKHLPSLAVYEAVASDKTSALFVAAVKGMQELSVPQMDSSSFKTLVEATEKIGLMFQVNNDIKNYKTKSAA